MSAIQVEIYRSLISHFGTQARTAERLRVDQTSVSGWLCGRHGMSAFTALLAEAETQGLFKAVDLCPRLKAAAPETVGHAS